MLVAALLVVAHAPAVGQEPFTERVGVTRVLIDVRVFDRQEHPVTDLTSADFTVRIGGRTARVGVGGEPAGVHLAPFVHRDTLMGEQKVRAAAATPVAMRFSCDLRISKSQAIAVWVDYAEFSSAPGRVLRRFMNLDTSLTDFAIELIKVIYHNVRCPTNLAFSRMLCKKEGQPISAHLGKHRESWLEAMFPLHSETQAVLVEGTRTNPVRRSQLWCNALAHGRFSSEAQCKEQRRERRALLASTPPLRRA